MRLGKIVGTVVSTRKDSSLESLKLLVVENLATDLEREGGYVVAVDSVGAGLGEVILYATGSSARQTAVTKDKPVDAVIMAIVDSFDIEGRSVRLA
ncbi:MAG: EutN/CcmL family microcompartment protein [Gemmatimonadaceae bacterium]